MNPTIITQHAQIHYNGWGSRWDEWIPSNSSRLAPFRTFTVQNPKAVYLQPYPNITPDAPQVQQLENPYTNQQNGLNKMMEDILSLVGETS